MELIDKAAVVAEIENRIKKYTLLQQKPEMSDLQKELQDKIDCLNSIKGYILNTLEVKAKEEHFCGECKHFGYNVMGECICNLENGNKKASPYVGACEDNFTTKN